VPGRGMPGPPPGRRLPRTDLHRINITAVEQGATAPLARESRDRLRRLVKHSQRGMRVTSPAQRVLRMCILGARPLTAKTLLSTTYQRRAVHNALVGIPKPLPRSLSA
jgi:hypothetical protein